MSERAASESSGSTDSGASRGEHLDAVRDQLRRLEHLLDPEKRLLKGAETHLLLPAWRRVTSGEPRWPASGAIVLTIVLQFVLPAHVAVHPRWLLPALEMVMLAGVVSVNPRRIDRLSPRLRAATMSLIGVISIENAWSAGKLVVSLVRGTPAQSAEALLVTGAAIWLTNMIVFSLWYWELDRGGPAARAHGVEPYPDFLFPQMENPHLASDDWEPLFADYLYVSFTNATAFSPTDVLPLSRWAKMTMMLQSTISLVTVALVVARAVNILK